MDALLKTFVLHCETLIDCQSVSDTVSIMVVERHYSTRLLLLSVIDAYRRYFSVDFGYRFSMTKPYQRKINSPLAASGCRSTHKNNRALFFAGAQATIIL